MSTIPASEIVAVNPSVLSAGGNSIDVIGLLLTTNVRVPIGTVASFPDALSVSDYFGASSTEATIAGFYFSGFDGSSRKPGSVLFAQYPSTAVAAYLRGGNISELTLAELQAISGTLSVVVDGYTRSNSVNLSGAGSLSNAASTIQTDLNTAPATEASFTGHFGATFTGTQVGTALTAASVVGTISVGDVIAGTGVTTGTTILAFVSGTEGSDGVYTTSVSGTASSAACTATSTVLEVTVLGSGTLAVGQTVVGSGVTVGTIITALGTGTGSTGTYIVNDAQEVASEAMTTTPTPVVVSYDSVSGAFIITSGVTGAASTVAFATGSIAADLLLTSATGAVTSQGSAAATPAAFMNGIVEVTTDWVTFMTLFNPDASGSTNKQAFAAWKDTQNNRYAYSCWDTDVTPTATLPATSSLGYVLAHNGDSGTSLNWSDDATNGPELAAFICGAAASIDFTERNGRITFAFKAQAGLTPTVTTATVANNLAGSPQAASRGNGYNFYGAYAQANSSFTWYQRGFVTGDFLWLDSYINQIWLNSSFQTALLVLMQNARSIPYNAAGNSLIQAALADPIAAGLNFGAYAPGTISAAQIAEVNADAGANIASTLQTQGYYLQVLNASSTVQAARGSPPCKFFYLDRGSVQAITLSSIAVQ